EAEFAKRHLVARGFPRGGPCCAAMLLWVHTDLLPKVAPVGIRRLRARVHSSWSTPPEPCARSSKPPGLVKWQSSWFVSVAAIAYGIGAGAEELGHELGGGSLSHRPDRA